MAIYHMSGQVISRISNSGTKRSAISCAAYRSGEKLRDYAENETKFYKRDVKPDSFILAPKNCPDWVYDREKLWNAVEKSERQCNAQLAREFNIALPVELDKYENKKLATEFCQEAFVNSGMIADVALHYDHKNNPHFHVMLTMREMKEDGSFMPKCRKEYVLDESGNKIMLPSGNYKSIRVNTNDWNNPEKMNEWRNLWEEKANEFLEKNGFAERISAKSNIDILPGQIPTIHEGYAARKIEEKTGNSDRVNTNKNIKNYNEKVVKIEQLKREKLSRYFAPAERKYLSDVAKKFHQYIDIESVEKMETKMLIYERHSFNTSVKGIDDIYEKRDSAAEARQIIEKEAERFFNKNYSGMQNDLTANEMAKVVDSSVKSGTLMSKEEMDKFVLQMRNKEFNDTVDFFMKRENANVKAVVTRINNTEKRLEELQSQRVFNGEVVLGDSVKKIDRVAGTYHIYQNRENQCFIGIKNNAGDIERHSDYMSIRDAYEKLKDVKQNNTSSLYVQYADKHTVGRLQDRIERLEKLLLAMDHFYDQAIKIYHPDIENVKELTMKEKEIILGIRDDKFEKDNSNFKENNITDASVKTSVTVGKSLSAVSGILRVDTKRENEIEQAKSNALKKAIRKEQQKKNGEQENSI